MGLRDCCLEGELRELFRQTMKQLLARTGTIKGFYHILMPRRVITKKMDIYFDLDIEMITRCGEVGSQEAHCISK